MQISNKKRVLKYLIALTIQFITASLYKILILEQNLLLHATSIHTYPKFPGRM